MSDASDEELIRTVIGGNDRAFELLTARYQDVVARYIWRVVPNPEDREEVCQDVFVKAYFNLAKFRFDAKFSTWLYQIAYRSAISFNRRKRIDTVEYVDEIEGEYVTPEGESHQDSVKKMLDGELAKLKLDERSIVTLYYLQEMGIEEIGEIVSKPQGTVKSILHRVRDKMRTSIERMDPGIQEAV